MRNGERRQKAQQKTPTSSSARTKGRDHSQRHKSLALRGLPRYHLEYAGSLPFRRAFLPDGRGIRNTRCALNQGYAITGFPGLIYLPVLTMGVLQSLFSWATFRVAALAGLSTTRLECVYPYRVIPLSGRRYVRVLLPASPAGVSQPLPTL